MGGGFRFNSNVDGNTFDRNIQKKLFKNEKLIRWGIIYSSFN